MAPSYGKRSRGGGGGYGGKVQTDPATRLHDTAAKLYDQGSGHGADWCEGAEALFRCAFTFLKNAPASDPRKHQIARRVLDVATSLVAGSEDSGAPYTAPGSKPDRPAFTMTDPAPKPDPPR